MPSKTPGPTDLLERALWKRLEDVRMCRAVLNDDRMLNDYSEYAARCASGWLIAVVAFA